MKRWCTMVVLLCLTTAHAWADEASKRAKVEELFAVMHLDRTLEQVTTASQQQVMAAMKNMPGFDQMTADQKRLLDEYEVKAMALVTQAVGWKVIEPDMVKIYSETYSEEEIDGILGFYKSPIGQSMLAKTPELTTKTMQITQQRAAAVQPQLQALMMDMMKRLAGPGANGGMEGPPPPAPRKPNGPAK